MSHTGAGLWMIGAIISFTSMAVAGRAISGQLDTFEIMLYRSILGFLVVVSMAGITGAYCEINFKFFRIHLVRNIFHFIGQNLWFFALPLIPLAQLFALEFTSPIWVVLLAPIFLGEKLTIKKLSIAALGFFGVLVDPEFAGTGMDYISYSLIMEELSKVDNSCSVIVSAHNSLACWGIQKYGTEEQKQKYLPRLASGEIIGAFCLSEPEAGSDATSQTTEAIDMVDHYILNGTKNWITNGNSASTY